MQDAQRINRILADISLCERLEGAVIRSIVQRLHDHAYDENKASLDQCLGWLDDDISDNAMQPEISGIEVTHIRAERADESQLEKNAPRVPYWMTGASA